MKFTKEQRLAIIRRVTKIANSEYNKRVNEAIDNYVPSEEYKRLENALQKRKEACSVIRELWGGYYALDSLDINSILKEFKIREINIKKPNINKEDLNSEIILNQCDRVEELISHLLELVSKNSNN